MNHTAFSTRCILQNCLKHLMVPKSKSCNMSVQFVRQQTTFIFLRNDISCGYVAQLSTNNKMFLPCIPVEALSALRNTVKMVTLLMFQLG
jgi:hypothetical protein